MAIKLGNPFSNCPKWPSGNSTYVGRYLGRQSNESLVTSYACDLRDQLTTRCPILYSLEYDYRGGSYKLLRLAAWIYHEIKLCNTATTTFLRYSCSLCNTTNARIRTFARPPFLLRPFMIHRHTKSHDKRHIDTRRYRHRILRF